MIQSNPNGSYFITSKNVASATATAILVVSFIISYSPVWKDLVTQWYNSDDYSHGFFILPICLYILYQKKTTLARTFIKPSIWGLLIAISSLTLYLFANYAEIKSIASFSMIPLLAGVIIYLFGFLVLKELLYILFLLCFMIPIPLQIYSSLTIPLQLLVSKASVGLALNLGIPIYREGNVIHLPQQTLEVVRACSGIRSLVSLLTLCSILGYFTLKSNFLRTILFFSGIPSAIFVNIIRVLLIIIAFHYLDFDLTQGNIHTIFGILIFILALILISLTKEALKFWDRSA